MRTPHKLPKIGTLIAILLTLVLVASACGDSGGDGTTTGATTGGTTAGTSAGTAAPTTTPPAAVPLETLTVALGQNPITFDPQLISQAFVRQIANLVYDPLVWTLFVDGETVQVGGLAESWESNADATEFTFNLKQGVTFHDGTPFNAESVKFTFDRIADPNLEAQLAASQLGPYERSEIIDDHTIKVVFSAGNALFIEALSGRGLSMGSPTAIQADAEAFGLNPVGTGAYIFEEFQDRQIVRLSRNPAWSGWSPAPYADVLGPDEIIFRILEDGTAQFNAVQTGEIDVAQSTPMSPQNLATLRDSGDFSINTSFGRGVPFSWIFNVENGPVSDVLVRQAFSHAIDKSRLIETVLGGVYVQANSPFTGSTPGSLGDNPYPYDPAMAADLLDQAGWVLDGDTRKKDGEPMVIAFYTMTDFPVYDQMAPFVQAQLGELGIEVNITSQSWPGIGDTLTDGIHHMAITSLTSSSAPSAYNAVMSCASDARLGGFNWSFYCNPDIDAAMNAAAGNPDAAARTAALEALTAQIMADAPYIPMVENSNSAAMRNGLEGFLYVGTDGTPIWWAIHESM